MDRVRTKAKAVGPPATAALATALQLLQSASSVPGCPSVIGPVCSVALQVIQMAQTAQQNRETCDELVERISQIMVVVLTPYVTPPAPDMTTGMRENIERLTTDLVDISRKLQEVLGKNVIKAWTLSAHYKQKIAGCSTKLDWAMNVFKVDTLLRLEIKLDALTLQQSNSSTMPAIGIYNQLLGLPPQPEIFFGREEVVEDIVRRLASTQNGRFSIGGPGGLGKTSVALTSVHDPRVVAKFEDRRPKISTSSTGLLEQVIARLGRGNAPTLVLLDNFETPWDVEDQRLDVETILKHLVSVPSVTLLLTVRSSRPPCKAVKWTQPVLDPLDSLSPDAARQLYTEYDSNAARDPALDTLLHALSYMPLAVTLMAVRGASGESPRELLTKWESLGTATLGRSGTKLESVQTSIRLSTTSQMMTNNPNALKLLSLLTLLPTGAPRDLLVTMAPDIDADGAFHILQKVSLAYLDSKSKCVSLLSPIRQFVEEFHPPTEQQLDTIFQVYRHLLFAAREKVDSEMSWSPLVQAVIDHFPNVEAILLKRVNAPTPKDAIKFASDICLWHNSPANLRLIQGASTAAKRVADPFLKAKCNYALATITAWTNRRKAISTMKDSLVAFRDLKEQQWTMWCLRYLAEWLSLAGTPEEASSYAEQAVELARSLKDDGVYAESLATLARIAVDQGRLEDALAKIEQAFQMQQKTAQTKGDASVIGPLLIYAGLLRQCKRFKEAHEKLEEASLNIRELADRASNEAWRQQELGDLYRDEDRIDDALTAYTVSAAENRKGGYVEHALWRQTDIGAMLVRHGQHDDAKAEFQRTLEEARENGFQKIMDHCMDRIDHIEKHRRPRSPNGRERPLDCRSDSQAMAAADSDAYQG